MTSITFRKGDCMKKFVQRKIIRLDVTGKNKDIVSWMLIKQSNYKDLFSTTPYFKITKKNGREYIDLVISVKYNILDEVFETKRQLYAEEGMEYLKLFQKLIRDDFEYNFVKDAFFVYSNKIFEKTSK